MIKKKKYKDVFTHPENFLSLNSLWHFFFFFFFSPSSFKAPLPIKSIITLNALSTKRFTSKKSASSTNCFHHPPSPHLVKPSLSFSFIPPQNHPRIFSPRSAYSEIKERKEIKKESSSLTRAEQKCHLCVYEQDAGSRRRNRLSRRFTTHSRRRSRTRGTWYLIRPGFN